MNYNNLAKKKFLANENEGNLMNFAKSNYESNERFAKRLALEVASNILVKLDTVINTTDDAVMLFEDLYRKILKITTEDQDNNSNDSYSKCGLKISDTVTDDYIVCLEDGVKLKMLKRHLSAHYNMTFQEYKEKWGLPHDYPAVCKNYSDVRQQIAMQTSNVRVAKMKKKNNKQKTANKQDS